MLIREVSYLNFDKVPCTRVLHFNLAPREMIHMMAEIEGGPAGVIRYMTEETDPVKILSKFEDLVLRAFGLRPDAEHFQKSDEIRAEFQSSLAFEAMFEQLSMDPKAEDYISEFFKEVFPPEMVAATEKAIAAAGGDTEKALANLQAEIEAKEAESTKSPTP